MKRVDDNRCINGS